MFYANQSQRAAQNIKLAFSEDRFYRNQTQFCLILIFLTGRTAPDMMSLHCARHKILLKLLISLTVPNGAFETTRSPLLMSTGILIKGSAQRNKNILLKTGVTWHILQSCLEFWIYCTYLNSISVSNSWWSKTFRYYEWPHLAALCWITLKKRIWEKRFQDLEWLLPTHLRRLSF